MVKYIPEVGDFVRLTEQWVFSYAPADQAYAERAIGLVLYADRKSFAFHVKWFNRWGVERYATASNLRKVEI